MATKTVEPEVSLVEAAMRLGKTYFQARDLLCRGALRGRKIGGRWMVTEASVRAAATEHAAPTLAHAS